MRRNSDKLTRFCALLAFKAWVNLRTEVSRFYLNYLWWIVDPLLSMAVYYVVFGIMLNRGTDNFAMFLMCGLVPWQWFQNTVNNASGSIYDNVHVFMEVNIHKLFFPLEVLLRDAFKNLLAVGVLLLFLLLYPAPFVDATWGFLPLLLLAQFLFNGGAALVAAALVPFLPDLRPVINTLLLLLMFVSGVFFRIEDVMLPEHRALAGLNPVLCLLAAYRDVLMYHKVPDYGALVYILGVAAVLLGAGFLLIARLDKIYPKVCLR